jgi:hypothetical protein
VTDRGRDQITQAVGEWGTLVESRLSDDPVARAVVGALAEGVGVSLIFAAEAKADWHTDEMFAKAAVQTALETLGERKEELASSAAKLLAVEYEKSLMTNSQFLSIAAKFGHTSPQAISKFSREYAAQQMPKLTERVVERVPAVLDLAREPRSLSALEEKLVGKAKRSLWRGKER